MRSAHIAVCSFVLSVLVSCQKELDIKYHDIDALTVIEGELTPDGIRVGITLTTPMDEPMDLSRLTDASVVLTDLSDGAVSELAADEDGFYRSRTSGIPGHIYRLTVERQGKVYEAETTMYAPSQIVGVEFNWIKMPYDQVAVLQGQFTDPSDGDDFFWIKVYRNGQIYMWNQMSDLGDVGGVLTFAVMTSRRDTDEEDEGSVLYDGDVVTVTVSGISRAMHDYLEALQNDSSGPAMFSGDRCLGYFMATAPVSASVVFHPDDIPVFE